MNSPLYVVSSPIQMPADLPPVPGTETADLLRQLLDVQREQVQLLRAQVAAQDGLAKWRAFLSRWDGEFPNIGGACKEILPALERAYLNMVRELTDRVRAGDRDDLDDEFVMGEFLDRYGIRLGQLGNIISQLSPIADAAPPARAENG
ncbi:MAG TPA: hypothetical protein VMZ71_03180 [Gemmataceae bacterium]|nr:hypothetical protein [Gemmataceae bacterium]